MNENSWQHWRASNFAGSPQYAFISMNENSWQHWRMTVNPRIPVTPTISMNENSWQHWREQEMYSSLQDEIEFPWMKIHGNIEGGSLTSTLFSYSDFHEWKFMATLKDCGKALIRAWTERFPWMKIHGNIEGTGKRSGISRRWQDFHEWKFMATLKGFPNLLP